MLRLLKAVNAYPRPVARIFFSGGQSQFLGGPHTFLAPGGHWGHRNFKWAQGNFTWPPPGYGPGISFVKSVYLIPPKTMNFYCFQNMPGHSLSHAAFFPVLPLPVSSLPLSLFVFLCHSNTSSHDHLILEIHLTKTYDKCERVANEKECMKRVAFCYFFKLFP